MAKALAEEEDDARREAMTNQMWATKPAMERQRLLSNQRPGMQGIREEVSHYGQVTDQSTQDVFGNDTGYEKLSDAHGPMKTPSRKYSYDGRMGARRAFRQRSLSLTPRATSIKIPVTPQKKEPLKLQRSYSLEEAGERKVLEYNDKDIKKFLTPLDAKAARRKLSNLDRIL